MLPCIEIVKYKIYIKLKIVFKAKLLHTLSKSLTTLASGEEFSSYSVHNSPISLADKNLPIRKSNQNITKN